MNNKRDEVVNEPGSLLLGRLIFQLQRLERSPHEFGAAGVLSPSEIHMIDAIGNQNSGLQMIQLAQRLGVTKGAVTQLIAKLERKNLVCRKPDATDARATRLYLTAMGEEACLAHMQMHLRFYEQIRKQLSAEEIQGFEKGIAQWIEALGAKDGEH